MPMYPIFAFSSSDPIRLLYAALFHPMQRICNEFMPDKIGLTKKQKEGYRRFRRSLHLQFPAIAVSADLLTCT